MLQDLANILLILGFIVFILWREYRHRRVLSDILRKQEAQNEAILKAADESELRYHSIFENSLDGIFLTAPDGRILAANPAACRMLERSEEEICQLGRAGVVDTSDPDFQSALAERSDTGKFHRELHLLKKDGTSFPAEITSAVFADRGGELRTSMIVRDISARKRAEETRRENEARFHLLIEKMPALLWVTDEQLRYTYSAGAALAQVGLKPEDLIGKQIGELSDETNPSIARGIELNRSVITGQTVSYDVEVMGRILHCDIEPLRDSNGKIVGTVGVGLDVTEHRLADRELIKLSRAIEQAEQAAIQEERQRMARDLHDSVTQSLYSLTLIAEAARRMAAAGNLDQASHYISRLGETARQALKEMRLMVFEMRPAELQEVGLVKALQQRLDDVEKRTGIDVHLRVEGQVNLPEPMVMPIYHIAQEALNNALKHANAGKIDVSICADHESFELDILDDGIGFDPENVHEMGGMGLSNMQERARQIGAELHIQSNQGTGTRVSLNANLPSGTILEPGKA